MLQINIQRGNNMAVYDDELDDFDTESQMDEDLLDYDDDYEVDDVGIDYAQYDDDDYESPDLDYDED